jgi:transcriptional regulator with XRE-family HTH domain
MTLREQLKFYNKTQQQFAFDLGVGVATVNRWINGKHPSKLAQKRLVEVLNDYETERQTKGVANEAKFPQAS